MNMFEEGAKFIIRGPLHAKAPNKDLTIEQTVDFAKGMEFAAHVQLVLDLMRPEAKEPVPDTQPAPHGWIVKRIGNTGAVILYADKPGDNEELKNYIANPDFRVFPFTLGGEITK